jgi:hypothetical protein
VVRESGDRVWAFRFTDIEGKRAQMEFARAGDRDGASGDVLPLSSAREKARDYKVALKREGIDPRIKKRAIERTAVKSTMHGCRTSFRNWGADNKNHNFRREVLEFCLSHRIGDEAELSHWDSEMIARRREALQAWADFIKPRKNASGEQPPERKRPKLKLVA